MKTKMRRTMMSLAFALASACCTAMAGGVYFISGDVNSTRIWYEDGTQARLNLQGTLNAGDIPNVDGAQKVRIGIGVTSIGAVAFENCSNNLVSVSIPGSVKTISLGAFQKCKNLSTLHLGEGI